jgi:hypothetical protein
MTNPTARIDLVITDRPGGADTGVLVYDPVSDTGHVLDGSTAAVLAACDGTRDTAAIAAHLAAVPGGPSDRRSVDLALQELSRTGLLTAAIPASSGMSRRTMIRTMALGAVGIAALPLIESITSARSANAQPARPVVQPKSASTTAGVPVTVTVTAINVVNPDDMVFWPVAQPANGTVTIVGNLATYTPDDGFIGTDTFPYTGGECVAAPGASSYPVPDDLCPAGQTVFAYDSAVVTIEVAATPETTTTTSAATPDDQITPSYTG